MARIWTDEEIGFIREHAADMRCSDLLEMVNAEFGKSYELHQLYNLKSRLGIRNLNVGTYRKGVHSSPNTEFKKGHKTGNKGISYQAGGRCRETQFKPGHMPHNHRPVGSERICYGKIQIKIAEPNKWEWLATLIWQSVNKQSLPRGHVIRFANGDITDYSPENLVAITKAQNAMLNHMNVATHNADEQRAMLLICDMKMTMTRRKNGETRKKP